MLPHTLRSIAATRRLEIVWPDGTTSALPHRMLRASCRCAHCRQARRDGATHPPPSNIELVQIEPYGEGAVRLGFSDGHARGIYPFSYLHELAQPTA